jgi:hypothetical protein
MINSLLSNRLHFNLIKKISIQVIYYLIILIIILYFLNSALMNSSSQEAIIGSYSLQRILLLTIYLIILLLSIARIITYNRVERWYSINQIPLIHAIGLSIYFSIISFTLVIWNAYTKGYLETSLIIKNIAIIQILGVLSVCNSSVILIRYIKPIELVSPTLKYKNLIDIFSLLSGYYLLSQVSNNASGINIISTGRYWLATLPAFTQDIPRIMSKYFPYITLKEWRIFIEPLYVFILLMVSIIITSFIFLITKKWPKQHLNNNNYGLKLFKNNIFTTLNNIISSLKNAYSRIYKKNPLLTKIAIIIGAYFLLSNYFISCCETPDDLVMSMLLSGKVSGDSTSFTVFMNSIIGIFLNKLYISIPQVDWYMVFYHGLLLISFTIIFNYVFFLNKSPNVHILGLILFITFIHHFITNIAFTTLGFLSSSAGLILLLTIPLVTHKKLTLIFSSLMIFIGSLIRFESWLLTVGLFIPIFIYMLYKEKSSRLYIIISLGIALLMVLLGKQFDSFTIHSNSAWNKYYNFQSYVGEIFDTPRLDNLTGTSVLSELGFSENDTKIMSSYLFWDKSVYSLEKFKLIYEKTKYEYRLPASAFNYLIKVIKEHHLYALITLLSLILFLGNGNYTKSTLLIVLFEFVLIVFFAIYLSFSTRLPIHVFLPLCYFGLVFILWALTQSTTSSATLINAIQNNRLKNLIIVFIITLILIFVNKFNLINNCNIRYRVFNDITQKVITKLNQNYIGNEEVILVNPVFNYPIDWAFPRRNIPKSSINQFLTGTLIYNPLGEETLFSTSSSNIFDFLLLPNVFVAIESPNSIIKYYEEHYFLTPCTKLIINQKINLPGSTIDDIRIYKIQKCH